MTTTLWIFVGECSNAFWRKKYITPLTSGEFVLLSQYKRDNKTYMTNLQNWQMGTTIDSENHSQ